MGRRQDLADALDAEMTERLLPDTAVAALARWVAEDGLPYVSGTGGHAVGYVPARWADVRPWPVRFGGRSGTDAVPVSRADVVAAVRDAAGRGAWDEALVASYVWGQGRIGYGPYRLREVLAQEGVVTTLSRAAEALEDRGPVAAYGTLHRAVPYLGPAFFTKFLYFAGLAAPTSSGPRALILDQRIARVLRAHATRVGLAAGMEHAAGTAAWIWSDGGWTPHRYGRYLDWMSAVDSQLARSPLLKWPDSATDLLELALFSNAWDPDGEEDQDSGEA
ncbi:hypothetical protein [Streptomyces sp. NPDC003077]|uniref:8-oxoguanine DNA glycosylase OGG fold protein n=1 Tax=Streptomyces sp. NPDC003077 TaxID=3154443 RepID=UPI0033AAFA78